MSDEAVPRQMVYLSGRSLSLFGENNIFLKKIQKK
jgi:hypothetical protein